MKVILTQNVHNIGRAGEVKNVADGYARNYLIPRGLAVKATAGALKQAEAYRAAVARSEEKLAAQAHALAERLNGVTLVFEAKAGETGHLYGSVTPAEIAEALERETGFAFDRRKHILAEPLREIGEHVVPIRLTADVTAHVKVVVKPEGESSATSTPDTTNA